VTGIRPRARAARARRSAVAAAVGGLLCLAPAAQAPLVIRLGVPANFGWDDALRRMAADWRTASRGAVELRPARVPGDEGDLVRRLRSGQVDAAALTGIGLGLLDDAFNVFAVPFLFATSDEVASVERDLAPVLAERLDRAGFVIVQSGSGGWVRLFSRAPVRSFADLKAARTASPAEADPRITAWYRANGFQPEPMSLADVPARLASGAIDAAPVPPLAALAFNWYRHAPHMLDIPLAPIVVATAVRKSVWDRVAEGDRAGLLAAGEAAGRSLAASAPAQERQAVDEMRLRALSVDPMGETARRAWLAAAERLAATARGTIVPAEIFDRALRAREAHRVRDRAGAKAR
jgi:TRAP-type C4-dicarboxylate transport system substrate-binding protein